jgi:uncharacterized protein with beta-barrel porin domain
LIATDRLAWAYSLESGDAAHAAFQQVEGSSFDVLGTRAAGNAGLVSLGAELRNSSGFGFQVKLDSLVARRSQSYFGTAGLAWRW